MAVSTYAELKTAVANWINRTDLTSEIEDFIMLAETKMNNGIAIDPANTIYLRVREMVSTDTVLLGTTDDAVTRSNFPIPSDFLELIEMRPTGTWEGDDGAETVTAATSKCVLEQVSNDRLESFYAGGGTPAYFALDGAGAAWNIWPQSSNWQITADYYAEIPALTTLNTTNDILTKYPDVYLYGALAEAEAFLGKQESTWRKQFILAVQAANSSSKRGSWSGPLRTKNPYGWTRAI